MLKKLIKDIFQQKGIYLLIGLGIINQLIFISIPYLGKIYIDHIQNKNLNNEFWFYIYIGISVCILGGIFGLIKEYYKRLRKRIYFRQMRNSFG